MMLLGLVLSAALLPLLMFADSLLSAALAMVPLWAALSLIVTPSLAFMAEAAAAAGVGSYGVVFGVYHGLASLARVALISGALPAVMIAPTATPEAPSERVTDSPPRPTPRCAGRR